MTPGHYFSGIEHITIDDRKIVGWRDYMDSLALDEDDGDATTSIVSTVEEATIDSFALANESGCEAGRDREIGEHSASMRFS
jgi:hypothetical protein